MLIPISHEASTVRRQPWVTYALMLSLIAVFFYTRGQDAEIGPAAHERLGEALEYLDEHPYLELPERLVPVLRNTPWSAMHRAQLEAMRDSGELDSLVPKLYFGEQNHLEALVDEAFDIAESHPFRRWGLNPSAPTVATFFSHMFLHGGWVHLIGNLLLLFLTGTFIEEVWGRPLYAGFCALSGLAGAALFVAHFPTVDLPLIGASGAISGCMGAFLVRYWNTRIQFFFWFLVAGTFSAPAWLMLPIWFGHEYLLAHISERLMAAGGVAYWDHVGGFAFGVLVAGGMRALRIEERFIQPDIDSKITLVSNAGVESALQAHEEGRAQEAFDLLAHEVRREPDNREAVLAFWDVAAGLQRAREAAPALVRLVRQELRSGEEELAVQHFMELRSQAADLTGDPSLVLRLVPLLREHGQSHGACEALEQLARAPSLEAAAALNVARAARGLDAGIAGHAARRALDSGELGPAEAEEAQSLCEAGSRDTQVLGEAAPAEAPAYRADALDLELPPEPPLPSELPAPGPPEEPPHFDLPDLDEPELTPAPDESLFDDEDDEDPSRFLASPDDYESLSGPDLGDPVPDADSGAGTNPAIGEEWGNLDLGGATELSPPALRRLSIKPAVPLSLDDEELGLEADGMGKMQLPLRRVRALAVVAVSDLGPKPVLVVDLVLNWITEDDEPLRVVRLRSDRFDPRKLERGAPSPVAALRGAITRILAQSRATPLPDLASVKGEPRFARFATLAEYERDVLMAEASSA